MIVVGALLGMVVHAQSTAAPAPIATTQATEPKFDPARDADKDIKDAVAEAKRTHRRVILDVGGEWCGWCHALDKYFAAHADLKAFREKSYVWLKVNYSTENKNEKVLSRYPKIKGYPHLFVLGDDGALLHSQDTSLLEEGSSYNLDKMKAFLTKWAPEHKINLLSTARQPCVVSSVQSR
jgi:thiol:disulfide interchange protein